MTGNKVNTALHFALRIVRLFHRLVSAQMPIVQQILHGFLQNICTEPWPSNHVINAPEYSGLGPASSKDTFGKAPELFL